MSKLNLILVLFTVWRGALGQDSFERSFKKFPELAPGVDFFAAAQSEVASFAKPTEEARARLAAQLGVPLARGAVVLCSSLEQKDAVNEARVLKLGYRWVIVQLTPEARQQDMLARMKAQLGPQAPPGMLERLANPPPEMKAAAEKALVASTLRLVTFASISTTLAPEREFRQSRLEDMGRSPLHDWLDIGLASHATGGSPAEMKYLQDHLDEAFPLEDVLTMSRPFVAPSASGSGPAGAPGMVVQLAGAARGPGGPAVSAPGPPPPGGGGQATPFGGARAAPSIPKDIQDRMLFDAQAAALFSFLLEKVGPDKLREIVKSSREGKSPRETLSRVDLLGPDLEKAEQDWQTWIKAQKVAMPQGMRFVAGPGQAPPPQPKPAEKKP